MANWERVDETLIFTCSAGGSRTYPHPSPNPIMRRPQNPVSAATLIFNTAGVNVVPQRRSPIRPVLPQPMPTHSPSNQVEGTPMFNRNGSSLPPGQGRSSPSRRPPLPVTHRRTWIQVDETLIIDHNSVHDLRRQATGNSRDLSQQRTYRHPRNPLITPRQLRHEQRRAMMSLMEQQELLNIEAMNDFNNRSGSGFSEECVTEFLIKCNICSNIDDQFCVICQEEIRMQEEMSTLNCSHVYHTRCIKEWLMIKNECSVCRAPVIAIRE